MSEAFYETMLNHVRQTPVQTSTRSHLIAAPSLDVREDEPTLDEVQKATMKLKNDRGPIPDGITPELLKYAEEPLSRALHELFHKVWTTGRILIEWNKGVIVSLYKGMGARNQCSSCRPTSLLSVPEKVSPSDSRCNS